MSYIPTLLASLEDDDAALRTRTLAAPPTALTENGAARKRPPRRSPQSTTPAHTPSRSGADPKPELAATALTGSRSETSTPRGRAATRATPSKRSVSSLSAEQLERLLADATSGLSAGAIAERAGVAYSRVLAQLRELEASGKVRRTGSRRSTLWLLSSDEDWVAHRTAELERLVGARRSDRSQRRGRARAS